MSAHPYALLVRLRDAANANVAIARDDLLPMRMRVVAMDLADTCGLNIGEVESAIVRTLRRQHRAYIVQGGAA